MDKGNDLYLWQRILDDFKKAEELLPLDLSIALCSILGVSSCDSYLDINPKQVLDQNILNKPSDIEGFVTAAIRIMPDENVCFEDEIDYIQYIKNSDGSYNLDILSYISIGWPYYRAPVLGYDRSDDCYPKVVVGVADEDDSLGSFFDSIVTYRFLLM